MNKIYDANPNDLFPSRFLKAEDIGDSGLTLTFQCVETEVLGQNQETKPVLYFAEADKGLVLNKTNCDVITQLYPGKIGNWIGKKITLYATEVSFGGRTTMGVRVRLRMPKPEVVREEQISTPEPPPNWEA